MVNLAPILRSVGLEYINSLVRGWQSKWSAPEAPKKVLTRSPWLAFSRNFVHILPSIVLIGLIWLNYTRYFIGPSFIENPEVNTLFLAGIQVCAKLEELLCIASLTAIVLHALRSELLGDGIPIGLLGSGIWFSSLSAFWSPEFLGTFSWSLPSWKRLRFYILLVLCGLVATTIGPASAFLMLPRLQSYPTGGMSFYMNGTTSQLWPTTVTASSMPEICRLANSTSFAICPSGGFNSLSQTLGAIDYAGFCMPVGLDMASICQAKGAEGNRQWNNFLIQSPHNNVPPMMNSWRGWYWGNHGSAAIQPHAATMVVAQQLIADWTNAISKEDAADNRQYKWVYDISTLASSTNPYVRTKCSGPQNISADGDQAAFPFLVEAGGTTVWTLGVKNTSITSLNRDPTTQIRTQWLPLPSDVFGDTSNGINTTGLLVEWPWTDGSRAVVTCAVAAAWHNNTIHATRSVSYDAWSIDLTPFDFASCNDSPDADHSNEPITLDNSWLELLTPPLLTTDSGTTTAPLNTFESILVSIRLADVVDEIRTRPYICNKALVPNATLVDNWSNACGSVGVQTLEKILAMVVVDGLSRFASDLAIDSSSSEPREWAPFTPVGFNRSRVFEGVLPGSSAQEDTLPTGWVTADIIGYSYNPGTAADYLALLGVCAFLFLALCHLIYTLRPRVSCTSNAWDTVTELLVLCQNSPPPVTSHALNNTASGIEQLKTYQALVKVRAFPPADGHGPAKLGLVLDDDATSAALLEAHHASSMHRDSNATFRKSPFTREVEIMDDIELQSTPSRSWQHASSPRLSPRSPPLQSSSPSSSLWPSSSEPHMPSTLRQHGLSAVENDHKYG